MTGLEVGRERLQKEQSLFLVVCLIVCRAFCPSPAEENMGQERDFFAQAEIGRNRAKKYEDNY